MGNRFVVIMLVCISVFVGLLFVGKKDANAPSGGGNSTVQASNHTVGKGTSGVVLIEYGDFECPACGAYYPIIKQIKEKFGDQITFQFRNYPLLQIHQNAMAAHRAAEAAHKQGKFFEMHDMLYERQQSWKSDSNPANVFEGYAAELGLNIDQFKKDVSSSEINAIIQADIREAQAVKATSTPTFVLNGKKIDENPRDAEGFIKLIEDAIKEKTGN
jgi:protein-disulfide isomerase